MLSDRRDFGNSSLFASELKAIQSGVTLDRLALANFFRSVILRPQGECGKVEPFWSLPRHSASPVEGDPVEAVENALKNAVRRRMVSDVPLGAFLSGGIDSSLIVALMQQMSSSPVQTFCIGFEDKAHDESPYARAVAQHLGTQHTEHRLSAQESLDVIPLLPRMYDEPFADSSQIPTYLVSKLARSQVTVALSGDGGDEVFGGYNRYFFAPRLWTGLSMVPIFVRGLMAAAVRGLSAEFLARFIPKVSLPEHKITKFLALLAVRSRGDLYSGLMGMWDPSPVLGLQPEPGLIEQFRWTDSFSGDMMELDAKTYLPDDILVKMDRASMAVSLECRAPFLDPEVAEVAWGLPMSWKVRPGKGKMVLRKLLEKHIPRDLLERPKIGVSLPLGDWLRGPLRGWAEDLLDANRLRRQGLLDVNYVQMRWRQHLSGKRNYAASLWCLLMFQAWHDEWMGG